MQKKISLVLCTAFLSTLLMAQSRKQQPLPPPPPPPIETAAPPATPKENRDFLQKNETVKNFHWSQSGNKLHIEYKDGRKEVYNLQVNGEVNKSVPGDTLPPPPPPPMPSTN